MNVLVSTRILVEHSDEDESRFVVLEVVVDSVTFHADLTLDEGEVLEVLQTLR